MPKLAAWNSRTPEEARLFNPPFVGALSYEFVKAYGAKQTGSAPLTLGAAGLAISLHGETRKNLPYSTVTSLYEWLQDHEHLLVGFPQRVVGLMPYIREGTMFGVAHNTLAFSNGYHLELGEKKANFPKSFLDNGTSEIREIIDRTRFVGRWFAKSGSEASILAAWGIRP